MFTIKGSYLRPVALGIIASVSALGLVACGGGSSSNSTPATSSASSSSKSSVSYSKTLLHTDGAFWAKPDGSHINLKGTNLGNWLVQEYWMMGQGGNGVTDQCTLENKLTERFGYDEKERLMKLFHDSWITERDWDQLQAFGFNVVRMPFLWSVVEDEKKPKTLRADAWHYFDWAIAEAKKRNMYIILDLHGVVGGQTEADHTGCSGQNKYWTNTDFQDRTKWLWEQVATHYKDEPTVVAYDPYNEPWGAPGKEKEMAVHAIELYDTIRKVDPDHIVLLHSYYGDIDVYGNPADKKMTNVAFQIHPYPGLFGDRPGDKPYDIHRDWLRCGNKGTDGVCFWNKKITALQTPLLIGEFQPWQGAGQDLGGQIARATYDTYASYGWAATSWSYKLVSPTGGQDKGTWGMVTNAATGTSGVGLVTKASTWDCASWNSSFANACAAKAKTIKVGGTGSKTYYFVIKTGALKGSNPDVTYDNISIVNDTTKVELIANGDFGTNNGWKTVSISGSEDIDFNNTTAGKAPTGSSGAVLRITRPVGVSDEINAAVYQAITLEGGQTYTLSGVFKDNGSSNTWAEMYLDDKEPTAGVDVIDNVGKVDFTKASITEIENLYKSYATTPYEVNSGLAKWLVSATAPDIFNLPAAPTNVKLAEGAGSNVITWDAAAKAVGYNLYRTTSLAKGFSLVNKAPLTSTMYTDTDVDGTSTYYYVVAALSATDEGYQSAVVNTAITSVSIPAKIQAEDYTAMSGIQPEQCTDTEGGIDIGHFETDRYIEFKINAPAAGDYVIDYRLATEPGSTGFNVLIDDKVVDTQAVAKTGGWQSWTTVTSPTIKIAAGKHTLRFVSIGKEWNINWFEIRAK